MSIKTTRQLKPELLTPRGVSVLTSPVFRLPSQRYPNMVTSSSVDTKQRRGLIIDVLA